MPLTDAVVGVSTVLLTAGLGVFFLHKLENALWPKSQTLDESEQT